MINELLNQDKRFFNQIEDFTTIKELQDFFQVDLSDDKLYKKYPSIFLQCQMLACNRICINDFNDKTIYTRRLLNKSMLPGFKKFIKNFGSDEDWDYEQYPFQFNSPKFSKNTLMNYFKDQIDLINNQQQLKRPLNNSYIITSFNSHDSISVPLNHKVEEIQMTNNYQSGNLNGWSLITNNNENQIKSISNENLSTASSYVERNMQLILKRLGLNRERVNQVKDTFNVDLKAMRKKEYILEKQLENAKAQLIDSPQETFIKEEQIKQYTQELEKVKKEHQQIYDQIEKQFPNNFKDEMCINYELMGDKNIIYTNTIKIEIDLHQFNLSTQQGKDQLRLEKNRIIELINNYELSGTINYETLHSIYLIYTSNEKIDIDTAKVLTQQLHWFLFHKTGLIADKHVQVSGLQHIPFSLHEDQFDKQVILPFKWDNTACSFSKLYNFLSKQIKLNHQSYKNFISLNKATITNNSFIITNNSTVNDNSANNIKDNSLANDNLINDLPQTILNNYEKMYNNPITDKNQLANKILYGFFDFDKNSIINNLNINNKQIIKTTFKDAIKIIIDYFSDFFNQTMNIPYKGTISMIKHEKHPSCQLNKQYNKLVNKKIEYVYHYNDFPSGNFLDMITWIQLDPNKDIKTNFNNTVYFLADILNISIITDKKYKRDYQNKRWHKRLTQKLFDVFAKKYLRNRQYKHGQKELKLYKLVLEIINETLYSQCINYQQEGQTEYESQILCTCDYIQTILKDKYDINVSIATINRIIKVLDVTKLVDRVYTDINEEISKNRKKNHNLPCIFRLINYNEKNGSLLKFKHIKKCISYALNFDKEKNRMNKWTNQQCILIKSQLPKWNKITSQIIINKQINNYNENDDISQQINNLRQLIKKNNNYELQNKLLLLKSQLISKKQLSVFYAYAS